MTTNKRISMKSWKNLSKSTAKIRELIALKNLKHMQFSSSNNNNDDLNIKCDLTCEKGPLLLKNLKHAVVVYTAIIFSINVCFIISQFKSNIYIT